MPIYRCSNCKKTFNRRHDLLRHKNKKFPCYNSNEVIYLECKVCNITFSNKDKYNLHIKNCDAYNKDDMIIYDKLKKQIIDKNDIVIYKRKDMETIDILNDKKEIHIIENIDTDNTKERIVDNINYDNLTIDFIQKVDNDITNYQNNINDLEFRNVINNIDKLNSENNNMRLQLEKLIKENNDIKSKLDFIITENNKLYEHTKIMWDYIPDINLKNNQNRHVVYKHIDFYDNNLVSSYINKKVVYIGYIGIINGEHLFKYGMSNDITSREIKHKRTYGSFSYIFISECLNNNIVENHFENELKIRNLHRKYKIKGKQRIELFTISIKYDIDSIKNILIDLIKYFPINKDPIISEYKYKFYMAIKENTNQIKKDNIISGITNTRYAKILDTKNS